MLLIAGCTAGQASPTAPDTPIAPSSSPTVSVSPLPAGSDNVLTKDDSLTCQAPSNAVMDWLHDHGNKDLLTSEVAVVYAGEGNNPGENWWVVAAVSYSDAWGGAQCTGDPNGPDRHCTFPRNDVSFLTNAPSTDKPSGDLWISIGRPLGADPGSVDWSNVSWTGERLSHGLEAQQAALSCLPQY